MEAVGGDGDLFRILGVAVRHLICVDERARVARRGVAPKRGRWRVDQSGLLVGRYSPMKVTRLSCSQDDGRSSTVRIA